MSKAKTLTEQRVAKKALMLALRDADGLADAAGIWLFTAVRYTNGKIECIECFSSPNTPEECANMAAESWLMAVESVDGEAELEEEESEN